MGSNGLICAPDSLSPRNPRTNEPITHCCLLVVTAWKKKETWQWQMNGWDNPPHDDLAVKKYIMTPRQLTPVDIQLLQQVLHTPSLPRHYTQYFGFDRLS